MTNVARRPELVINYSPELDLRFTHASAQGYGNVSLPEYRFGVDCRLRHSTGSFTYSATDVWFDLQAFAKFAEELEAMQQGQRRDADLKSVGEMTVFRLEGDFRKLEATLCARESIAANIATMNATLVVDYDLFVNKLRGEVVRFIEEIRQIDPSSTERS